MLRWCSYCQKFLGEAPPFENLRITHGICPSCERNLDSFDTDDLRHVQALKHIQAKLWEAGKRSDPEAAARVVEEARNANVEGVDVLMGIVAPMLYDIGVQWERAVVSVEEEHRFTAFCQKLCEIVSARNPPPTPATSEVESVVLMAVSGNHHVLALCILTLWLVQRGIGTVVVGPDQGLDDVVALLTRVKPRWLLVSIALAEQRPEVLDVVSAIGTLPKSVRPRVLVGGNAVKMGLVDPIPGAVLLADISEMPLAVR